MTRQFGQKLVVAPMVLVEYEARINLRKKTMLDKVTCLQSHNAIEEGSHFPITSNIDTAYG
jgi:hypothetical protein